MFLVDRVENEIRKLKQVTFSELKIRERDNLQEWIAKNPSCLGEELLIIQKEFDGFDDTRERLDLLAIDKSGDLVIIENKLDDSGKNVTWQCLKYASYCSSLKKSQIMNIYQDYLSKNNLPSNAEDLITDFLDLQDIDEVILNSGLNQRMILISANFRKEVTSTVLWLSNQGLRIQCFQTTPYIYGDQLLLNIDQIIPIKEAKEYSISIGEKNIEDNVVSETIKNRHIIRKEFWKQLLKVMNEKSNLFQNISPGKYSWIGAGSGMRGVSFNFSASKKYCRAELYIDRGDKETNEFILGKLKVLTSSNDFQNIYSLEWEDLSLKRACRVKSENDEFNIYESNEEWSDAIDDVTDRMVEMEKLFKPLIDNFDRELI